jgi:hypothetical protein
MAALGAEHDLTLRLRRYRAELRSARGTTEAVIELGHILAVRDALSPSPDREKTKVRQALGAALHRLGDLAEAEHVHDRTTAELTALLGESHPQTLLARVALAAVRAELGADDAMPELRNVLAAQLHRRGSRHPDVATTHHCIGLLFVATGDRTRSRTELDIAARIRTRRLGARHPATRATVELLARV